ncbi:methyltransferase [Marinactinospora rubrisoli]|uniref:Methyltransferase n=1 Tax=Marinactinospora rubrisoli TaxID=2715399 RepID=A0ABW2KNF8_9ACTN
MAAPTPAGPTDRRELQTLLRLSDLLTPMALRVAATLRLVDHIHAGTTSTTGLATATGTDHDALRRLTRHLVIHGVLTETAPGRLATTPIGDLLAAGHPARQRDWLDLNGAVSRADLAFVHLLDAVRTGRPAYATMHGRPFWDDLAADPALAASFDALMACDDGVVFDAPLAAYDWTGVQHVIDAGGGTGGLLAALTRAAPHVHGTLLELPGPAATARARLAGHEHRDRIDVLDHDFFTPFPATADAVTLSFVLLNWHDDDARRILAHCRAALRPGGRILLYERADVPNTGSDPVFSLLDLRMLVFMGGRVRTREEWAALAASAGLTIERAAVLQSPSVPFDFSFLVLAPHPTGRTT